MLRVHGCTKAAIIHTFGFGILRHSIDYIHVIVRFSKGSRLVLKRTAWYTHNWMTIRFKYYFTSPSLRTSCPFATYSPSMDIKKPRQWRGFY